MLILAQRGFYTMITEEQLKALQIKRSNLMESFNQAINDLHLVMYDGLGITNPPLLTKLDREYKALLRHKLDFEITKAIEGVEK